MSVVWDQEKIRNKDPMYIAMILDHMIEVLNRSVVYKVLNLRYTDKSKERLYGLCYYCRPPYKIFIDPYRSPRVSMVLTLIHEVMHVLFPEADHRSINPREKLFFEVLTSAQKRMLRKYIPKEFSDVKPT